LYGGETGTKDQKCENPWPHRKGEKAFRKLGKTVLGIRKLTG